MKTKTNDDKKIGTPCCNSYFKSIYGVHFGFMNHFKQWECEKCKKQFTNKQLEEINAIGM